MPLEIKELHIRVTVDNQSAQSGGGAAGGSGGGAVNAQTTEPDPALLDACVEKVLEILTRKTER